ncbi:serine/threonine protein kinase [Streptomyces sp. NPDC001700]
MGWSALALRVVVAGTPGGSAPAVEVVCEEEMTFGAGLANTPVDIPLDDESGEPVAGRIRRVDRFWLITNLSRSRTYVVENEEGSGEYVCVPPGRADMPVPFTRSRITLPSPTGLVYLSVTAPDPAYLASPEPSARPAHRPDEPTSAFGLDEHAKYFMVLVALCEPRLRDSSSPAIPSTPEIVRRLQHHGLCAGITEAAVNYHISYLARRKLRVRGDTRSARDAGARINWQRAAVVSTALRFRLVREEHLGLFATADADDETGAERRPPRRHQAYASGAAPPGPGNISSKSAS